VSKPDTSDPRYVELQKVMEADDAADAEIDRWITERRAMDPTDPRAESELAFRKRIEVKNEEIQKQYEALLAKHPTYAPARNAFASFLAESGNEEDAIVQLEKASEISPKDAAVWNNLANLYGHVGPIQKAFPAYEKAVELNPYEPVYRYNLATVVFLFRKDAMEYYRCDEQQVFNRALATYREVRRLRPNNFRYAFDYAQTYYGVKPAPADTSEGKRLAELKLAESARAGWLEALTLADNEEDRNGIFLHLARWNIRTGDFASARTNATADSSIAEGYFRVDAPWLNTPAPRWAAQYSPDDPTSCGSVSTRHGDEVCTGTVDGAVELLQVDALRDMTRWCDAAPEAEWWMGK
jgi:cytochrome c-type biogenesis protein CcmH/NrfG